MVTTRDALADQMGALRTSPRSNFQFHAVFLGGKLPKINVGALPLGLASRLENPGSATDTCHFIVINKKLDSFENISLGNRFTL